MGIWIRRGLRSAALGLATAWLVVWCAEFAAWVGWTQPRVLSRGEGIGVVEPWVVDVGVVKRPTAVTWTWDVDRFDRDGIYYRGVKQHAARIAEIGGAAFEAEWRQHLQDVLPELDEMMDGQISLSDERFEALRAQLPDPVRIDEAVADFPPPELARFFENNAADRVSVSRTNVGWPAHCASYIIASEFTYATPDAPYQSRLWSEGLIEIDSLKRSPMPGLPAFPLSLPYLPIWSGLAANTAVFAASWFALFTALAGARAAARTLSGRCPRCAYDLRRVAGNKCPECGHPRPSAFRGGSVTNVASASKAAAFRRSRVPQLLITNSLWRNYAKTRSCQTRLAHSLDKSPHVDHHSDIDLPRSQHHADRASHLHLYRSGTERSPMCQKIGVESRH